MASGISQSRTLDEKNICINRVTMAVKIARLIFIMQFTNLLILFVLSVKGEPDQENSARRSSFINSATSNSDPSLSRCRCQEDISHQSFSNTNENLNSAPESGSHEEIQWWIMQSAKLAHNQNVQEGQDSLSNSPELWAQINTKYDDSGGAEQNAQGELAGELLNEERVERLGQQLAPHMGKALWQRLRRDFTDDRSRWQFIHHLEASWALQWGQCVSRICDTQTCLVQYVDVACVGPCTEYRNRKCPKNRRVCATSQGKCPVSTAAGDRAHKESELSSGGLQTKPSTIRNSVKSSQWKGNQPTSVTMKPLYQTSQTLISHSSSNKVKASIRIDTGTGDKDKDNLPRLSSNSPELEEREGTIDDISLKRGLSRSQRIASGIRYIWVVSCIVAPTLIFCVGYAIAMHLRRKRFLQTQGTMPSQRRACDPFLAEAPPYSQEDLFSCPPGFGSGFNLPPPSYEDAMAEAASSASARNRTITECSAFSQEPLMASEALLRPPQPPPYEDIPSETSTERRGHNRLPSYESAVCLHTSI